MLSLCLQSRERRSLQHNPDLLDTNCLLQKEAENVFPQGFGEMRFRLTTESCPKTAKFRSGPTFSLFTTLRQVILRRCFSKFEHEWQRDIIFTCSVSNIQKEYLLSLSLPGKVVITPSSQLNRIGNSLSQPVCDVSSLRLLTVAKSFIPQRRLSS